LNVPNWVLALPHVNGSLNAASLVLLLGGFALIRNGRVRGHKRAMLCAFAASSAFLVCYLVYHFALHHYTGSSSRAFGGTGLVRGAYRVILFSHIVLAFFVPGLAIRMIYLAAKGRFASHRRWAVVAFPVWVYVSATGVIIYAMLYHLPAAWAS
jgi:protein SCO1/2/putative membrane protein